MFVGVHGDKLFLRMSDEDMEEPFKAYDGVKPFEPMPGRAMKGYVVLPKSLYSNKSKFGELVQKSFKYASGLPSKQKKK
jgi:hypothetical protein